MTGSAVDSVHLTTFFARITVKSFVRLTTQTGVVGCSAASETLRVARKRLFVTSIVVEAVHRKTSLRGNVELPFLSRVASETVSVG